MKVQKYDLKAIFKIIESKAKFQKVMLICDESISNIEIAEVYNTIKEICIYNQQDVKSLDINELNNGYRAIIYLCSSKNFLKLNFDKTEFVNICVVNDCNILPFCVNNDCTRIEKDLFIFTTNECFDVNIFSSLCFNKFYNYLFNVVNLKDCDFSLDFNNLAMFDNIQQVGKDFQFIDLDIIANTNIQCKHLCVLNLILINAFVIMLNNIKNNSLLLVDIYKVCRDDYSMLDKFYTMYNNEMFFTMINLNYNYLINLCLKVKEEILNNFFVRDLEVDEVENILLELKNYAKNSNNLVTYLYLYDFFKV